MSIILSNALQNRLATARTTEEMDDLLVVVDDLARIERMRLTVQKEAAAVEAVVLDNDRKREELLAQKDAREARIRKEEQDRLDAAARRKREADLHELDMIQRKAEVTMRELAARKELARVERATAEESRKADRETLEKRNLDLHELTVKEAILGHIVPTKENPYRAMAALAYRVHREMHSHEEAVRHTVGILALKALTLEEGLAYHERYTQYMAQHEQREARRATDHLLPQEKLNDDEA